MKIKSVIETIIENTNAKGVDPVATNDKIVIGNPELEATGIVSTFMATVEVIKRAIELNANLIITHEPTWFNGHDKDDWLDNDMVYKKKKELIEQNNIVIWRFHDYMHSAERDQIYQGFEQELGWETYRLHKPVKSDNPLEHANICYDIPKTDMEGLLKLLKEKLGLQVIRYIGDKKAGAQRIGLLLGGSSLGLGDEVNPMKLVHSQNLDTVICGDITEWTLSAYIRDASMMGLNKSMIVLGHEKSEEVGMKNIVPWMKKILPDIEIHFIEAGEPFRYFLQ